MNRSELVHLVAKKSRLEPDVVEVVLNETAEIISMMVSMREAVSWRNFGRFRPVVRAAASLRNPMTGEPHESGPRLSIGFTPCQALKKRLNNEGDLGPKRRREVYTYRAPSDQVHRYLWNLVDDNRHYTGTVSEIAVHFGVQRDVMARTLESMGESGRIRWIKMMAGRRSMWEVSNPNTFNVYQEDVADRPPARRQTAWG